MSIGLELAMEVLESQEVTESMREKAKMVIRGEPRDMLHSVNLQPETWQPPTLREWLATPMMQEWISLHALPQLPAQDSKEDQPQ